MGYCKLWVKITIISQAPFLYESALPAFLLLQFDFVTFWQKNIGAKASHKMLMKLTKGVKCKNFL
jgi:hypothetical protein